MKPQTETTKREMPQTQTPNNMNADQTQRQPSEYEESAPERRQRPTDTLPEATQTEGSFRAGPGTRKPVPQGDETETENVIGDRPERADQAYELNQPKKTH